MRTPMNLGIWNKTLCLPPKKLARTENTSLGKGISRLVRQAPRPGHPMAAAVMVHSFIERTSIWNARVVNWWAFFRACYRS